MTPKNPVLHIVHWSKYVYESDWGKHAIHKTGNEDLLLANSKMVGMFYVNLTGPSSGPVLWSIYEAAANTTDAIERLKRSIIAFPHFSFGYFAGDREDLFSRFTKGNLVPVILDTTFPAEINQAT